MSTNTETWTIEVQLRRGSATFAQQLLSKILDYDDVQAARLSPPPEYKPASRRGVSVKRAPVCPEHDPAYCSQCAEDLYR